MALAQQPRIGRRVMLVRHGSRPAGEDPWLDPKGEREAKSAAAYLSADDLGMTGSVGSIAAVYSSPFLRTLQTSVPIAQALGLLIRVEFGFSELLAKAWLQKEDPLPAIQRRDLNNLPFKALINHSYQSAVMPVFPEVIGKIKPGINEQRASVVHRHRRAVQAALAAADGGSILIVCHSSTHDFVAAALCPNEHLVANHTGHHCVPHCAITEIVEHANGWQLRCYGRTPMDLGFVDTDEIVWMLKLGDPAVRCNSLESLGSLGRNGDIRAVKPVVSCLKDQSRSVRQAALEALRRIADGDDTIVLEAAREAVLKCHCKSQRTAMKVLGVTDSQFLSGRRNSSRHLQKQVASAAAAAIMASVVLAVGVALAVGCRRLRRHCSGK